MPLDAQVRSWLQKMVHWEKYCPVEEVNVVNVINVVNVKM